MRRRVLLAVIGTWALAASALAEPGVPAAVNPVERLRAAQGAEDRLTLRATLNTATFFRQSPVSSQVTVYRKPGHCRWEYQASVLKGMVMIEKGEAVIRLDPARQTASVGCSRREPGLVDLLLKNYRVTLDRTEPIIGRTADVLVVAHPETGRPSKKIWVDRDTGLILRSEYYDCDGRLATLSFYTDIDWNPRLDDRLFEVPEGWKTTEIEGDASQHWEREKLSKEVAFPVCEPAYLPAGFALDGFHLYRCRCGVASAHVRYVDGLNSVSVFERFTQCPGRGGRGFGRGRGCELLGNQPGRMLVRPVGGRTFVLVGDLPEAVLLKIADSLQ